MIPSWLTEPNPLLSPATGVSSRFSFVTRTIEANVRFLRNTVFLEEAARADGFLQSLEPRCKLIAVLTLIVTTSLLHSTPTVWMLYLLTLFLAVAARINLDLYLKRVWLAVPLFSFLIALPATLNIVTPGNALWVICRFASDFNVGPWRIPEEIIVTSQGVAVAMLFVGRVAVSVSLATILTLSTPWNHLMASLRAIRVPALFLIITAMAYRYVFVLVNTVIDLYLARRSRTVRPGATNQEQQWVAGRIWFVFRKSLQTGNEVHDAMIARGFGVEVRTLSGPSAGWRDRAAVGFACLLSLMLIIVDRMS